MKKKPIYVLLLTILTLVFVVFVIYMQQQFNNPEFTDLPTEESIAENSVNEENEQDEESTEDDSDTVAGAAGSVVNEETEEEDQEEREPTYSTRTVTVDTLNARSGPGIDYEITGVLLLDQEVEVEDVGEDWVRVITDDFEGYVNENYLSEE